MGIYWKTSDKTIGFFTLIFTIFLLFSICEKSCSSEYYNEAEYEDNILSVEEESNTEEDYEVKKNWDSLSVHNNDEEQCNEDKIMYYLAELQVINPETILQIASFGDLHRSCRKIAKNLKSIGGFMLTCNPLPQNHLYMQLIMGVRVLYARLCVQSDYQSVFKEHMECFQELHNEYIDCGGPADWTENMENGELCTEYKAIADCYYIQTALLCGLKAAKIMKELVVRVINAVIETSCPEVRENPLVENPMPEHSINTRKSSTSKNLPSAKLHLLLLLLLSYCIVY